MNQDFSGPHCRRRQHRISNSSSTTPAGFARANRSRVRTDRGFTLIELMVVVLIIGILLSIAIPTFLGARVRGQDAVAKTSLQIYGTAAAVWFTDEESYDGIDADSMSQTEGALAYVGSSMSSSGPKIISVAGKSEQFWGAALSDSGVCFGIYGSSTGALDVTATKLAGKECTAEGVASGAASGGKQRETLDDPAGLNAAPPRAARKRVQRSTPKMAGSNPAAQDPAGTNPPATYAMQLVEEGTSRAKYMAQPGDWSMADATAIQSVASFGNFVSAPQTSGDHKSASVYATAGDWGIAVLSQETNRCYMLHVRVEVDVIQGYTDDPNRCDGLSAANENWDSLGW